MKHGLRPEPRNVGQRYLCEVCGLLGRMDAFRDECRPGWTHGRLHKVNVEATYAKVGEQ